ncbi:clathrin interactor EPSIN 1 isoform X2 [Ricinus communis]|uniref:clathrin interactor EPSIN 1 isoform X2 n=1 Tax=Ricinus communis TaxID=3988 RepID=UPI00201A376E|nr:clathrin interactor EPSIN 1 isoform X2 [Ricinus communis]
MDFMKVFDQTVREIKREVNLKVLKVPEIEQKVLDATDDAPWGPHGTACAEIAQATKKFTECQMVMNVLWTRLGETGKDWRLVYKALTVIEYLVAHGSERAVDDIIEHTFQISSLTSFEYVEPSGKDVGLNVRKKAENIVALLNNKDKIQETRNKAAANRDKYVGVSSSGITYKSGSASYSGGSFQSSSRYGGFSGTRDTDNFRDSYKDKDQYGVERSEKESYGKSRQGGATDDQGYTKKGSTRVGRKDQNNMSKSSSKTDDSYKKTSVPSQHSRAPSSNYNDEFDDDDFDPRGTSSSKSTADTSNQVDLFGQDLIGDLMDAPTSIPTETSAMNGNSSEADLFADATFVSAPPQVEKAASPQSQTQVDLFASQPAVSLAVPSTVDFFSTPDPVVQPETNVQTSNPTNNNIVDPFATVPLNSFDGSDLFGAFSSSSNSASAESTQSPINDGSLDNLNVNASDIKPPSKKETFQVKSGIWADSLSRGLIDLNISAPKKVSLVDVGVVGDLTVGQDDRDKGLPASFYMGRAMGTGSGLGRSGFTPQATQSQATQSQAISDEDFFSSLSSQQHQFDNSKH